jgi:hypothetical protein
MPIDYRTFFRHEPTATKSPGPYKRLYKLHLRRRWSVLYLSLVNFSYSVKGLEPRHKGPSAGRQRKVGLGWWKKTLKVTTPA